MYIYIYIYVYIYIYIYICMCIYPVYQNILFVDLARILTNSQNRK